MKKKRKVRISIKINSIIFLLLLWQAIPLYAADFSEEDHSKEMLLAYQEYQQRLDAIEEVSDIEENQFHIIEEQVFPLEVQAFGEVELIPAMDTKYQRLAFFWASEDGTIVYKTDQLETNFQIMGELKQLNEMVKSIAFEDINGDGLLDIILITRCINETGRTYKVGDVLFQNGEGFYRDWRISDKINRFSMNKSTSSIISFVRDGYSTEFLYTVSTLEELLDHGFEVIPEQSRKVNFEKLGKLQVVPGTYRMSHYEIFMTYLVNDQGYIVWSFQTMGNYENLYALRGITSKDINGDGLRDIVIMARYSYEEENERKVVMDYSIYYQKTGGFYEDTDLKNSYQCTEDSTLEELVKEARAYWGWQQEE